MNASRILKHALAKKLFENFLKLGHKTDKSRALEEIECFDLCKLLLENIDSRTDENVERLAEMCPNYKWESELQETFSAAGDDPEKFEQFLESLMAENVANIESHSDYTRFHETLLDKLRKNKMLGEQKCS